MKYYKREWKESRGDEYDSWGTSIWYFETSDLGIPIRQMEIYESGNILKYSEQKPFDKFGQLGVHELDLDEFQNFEIGKDEFEKNWFKHL